MPALAAGLLDQVDLAQLHALIHGLAHIVDGEQRGRNAGQSFHFHAGHADGPDGAHGLYGLLFGQKVKIHSQLAQRQRMAQGDQLAGALGRHDACNAGHAQHVALLGGAVPNSGKGCRIHSDDAAGHSLPCSDGLFAHIHHHGAAGRIKMRKFCFAHNFYLDKALPFGRAGKAVRL